MADKDFISNENAAFSRLQYDDIQKEVMPVKALSDSFISTVPDIPRFDFERSGVGGVGGKGGNLDFIDFSKNKGFDLSGKGYQDVQYNIPFKSVYTTLNSGESIGKYKNYIDGITDEDRLARQQGSGEKFWNGANVFAKKTLWNALDFTAGLAYGVYKGVTDLSFDSFLNNEVSKYFDDLNEQTATKYKGYRTKEAQSMNILERMVFDKANFWFVESADAMSFVTGALLPDIALTVATGGAGAGKLATTLGRVGAKIATAEKGAGLIGRAANLGVRGVDDLILRTAERQADKSLTNSLRTSLVGKYYNIGDATSTALFAARTALPEAAVEARHSFHDNVEKYMDAYIEKHGVGPDLNSMKEFIDDARIAANNVFIANAALLSISNTAQFAKAFGYKVPSLGQTKLGDAFNRAIGLGYKTVDGGKLAMRGANKFQKTLGWGYLNLKNPITEGFEEGAQGVFTRMMDSYLENKYSDENSYAFDFGSELMSAFSSSFGTKEGWDEVGMGMLMGFFGRGLTRAGRKEAISDLKGIKDRFAEKEKAIERANKGQDKYVDKFGKLISSSSVRQFRNNAFDGQSDNHVSTNMERMATREFIKSQEGVKGLRDITSAYDTMIDNMQLDQETIDLLESSGGVDAIAEYKQSLKNEFRHDLESYKFSEDLVEKLGISDRLKDYKPAEIKSIEDSISMGLYLGHRAKQSAEIVAEQMNGLLGFNSNTNGIFNALSFYSSLSQEEVNNLQVIYDNNHEIKLLRNKVNDKALELGRKQSERAGNLDNAALEGEVNELSEEIVSLNAEIDVLTKQNETITNVLSNKVKGISKSNAGNEAIFDPNNIEEYIHQVQLLDDYVKQLKQTGRTYQADSIRFLQSEFKQFMDQHFESETMIARMMSTDFFKKDGESLVTKILGPEYVASDDFIEMIKNNERALDEFSDLVSHRGEATIEEKIKGFLNDYDALTSREKFRLESLMRVRLTAINRIREANRIFHGTMSLALEPQVTNELEGDIIKEMMRAVKEGRVNTNNVKELQDFINKIMDELSYIKNKNTPQELDDIAKLEEELAKLQQQLNDFNSSIDDKALSDELSKANHEVGKLENEKKLAEVNHDNLLVNKHDLEELRKQNSNEFSAIQDDIKSLEDELKDTEDKARQSEIKKQIKDLKSRKTVLNKDNSALRKSLADLNKEIKESEKSIKEIDNKISALNKVKNDLTDTLDKISKDRGDITDAIKSIEDQINAIKKDPTVTFEIDKYERMSELWDKDNTTDDLTDDEKAELQELGQQFDDWTMVLGINIEGIRLSDLVRQLSVLKNTEVANLDDAQEVTVEEVNEITKQSNSDSSYDTKNNQVYDVVMSEVKKRKDGTSYVKVSGITEAGFLSEFPSGFNPVYKINPTTGVIEIDLDEVERINRDTNVSILPTGENGVPRNYAPVRVKRLSPKMNGTFEFVDLKTDFDVEFESPVDTDVIYGLSQNTLVDLEINVNDKHTRMLVHKYISAIKNGLSRDEIDAIEEELRASVVINTKVGGSSIGVLKGKRPDGTISEEQDKFMTMRDTIVNEFIKEIENAIVAGPKLSVDEIIDNNISTIEKKGAAKVEKVYPGYPSFTYEERISASGKTVDLVWNDIDDSSIDNGVVVDAGYIINGEMRTKNRVAGIDTTFVDKAKKKAKGIKTTFVVVQMNGKNIALPMRLKQETPPNTQEIIDVFNNEFITDIEKVVRLNKMLAEAGIDITVDGNAFLAVGNTNLTNDVLNNFLDKINNKSYFRSTDNWLHNGVTLKDIVENMETSIDLTNPLHSPKVRLDFSDTFSGITGGKYVNAKSTSGKKGGKQRTGASALSSLIKNAKKCS